MTEHSSVFHYLQEAREKVEQSGEHAEHHRSFCNQKLYVMLTMDWYDLRGGDNANPFSKQYFDVRLDEETGEALTTERDQEFSDSDDELSLVKKRKQPREAAEEPMGKRREHSPDSQKHSRKLVTAWPQRWRVWRTTRSRTWWPP